MGGKNFSKVLYMLALPSMYTRTLTFEKLCQVWW
jgi:hypothetical protein